MPSPHEDPRSRSGDSQRATRRHVLTGGTTLAATAVGLISCDGPGYDRRSAHAQEATPAAGEFTLYQQSPWWPWLTAHMDDQEPPDVVGGPITTTATQEDGQAFWVFPGPRELDPTVFGTPENPKGTEVPPCSSGSRSSSGR